MKTKTTIKRTLKLSSFGGVPTYQYRGEWALCGTYVRETLGRLPQRLLVTMSQRPLARSLEWTYNGGYHVYTNERLYSKLLYIAAADMLRDAGIRGNFFVRMEG